MHIKRRSKTTRLHQSIRKRLQAAWDALIGRELRLTNPMNAVPGTPHRYESIVWHRDRLLLMQYSIRVDARRGRYRITRGPGFWLLDPVTRTRCHGLERELSRAGWKDVLPQLYPLPELTPRDSAVRHAGYDAASACDNASRNGPLARQSYGTQPNMDDDAQPAVASARSFACSDVMLVPAAAANDDTLVADERELLSHVAALAPMTVLLPF